MLFTIGSLMIAQVMQQTHLRMLHCHWSKEQRNSSLLPYRRIERQLCPISAANIDTNVPYYAAVLTASLI